MTAAVAGATPIYWRSTPTPARMSGGITTRCYPTVFSFSGMIVSLTKNRVPLRFTTSSVAGP